MVVGINFGETTTRMKPDAATGSGTGETSVEKGASAKKSEEQWQILSPEKAARHVKEVANELGISPKAALWLLITNEDAYQEVIGHLTSTEESTTKQPEHPEPHTPEDDKINPQLVQLIGEFVFNRENLTTRQLGEILQSLRQNPEFTHFDFVATLITGRFLDFARLNGVNLSKENPSTTLKESQALVYKLLTKLGITGLFDEYEIQELAKLYLAVQNVKAAPQKDEKESNDNINYPERPTVVRIYLDRESNKPIAVKLFVGKEKDLVKAAYPEQVEKGKIVLRPDVSIMESAVILIDPEKIKEALEQETRKSSEQIGPVTVGIEVEAFLGLLGEDIINFVKSLPEGHPLKGLFQELLVAMVEVQSEPFANQTESEEAIAKVIHKLQMLYYALVGYILSRKLHDGARSVDQGQAFAFIPTLPNINKSYLTISTTGAVPTEPKDWEAWIALLPKLLEKGPISDYVNRMANAIAATLKHKSWRQTPDDRLNQALIRFEQWHKGLITEIAQKLNVNLDELTPGQRFALYFPVSATHASAIIDTYKYKTQEAIIFGGDTYPILLSGAPLNFFGSALWGRVNKDVFSVRQALQSFVPQGRPGDEIIVPERVGEWLIYALLAFLAHPERTGPIPFIGRTALVAVQRDENGVITNITNIAYSGLRNRIASEPRRIEYTDPDGMPPKGKAFEYTAIMPPLLAEITTRALHIEQYLTSEEQDTPLLQAFNKLQKAYNQISQEYGSFINFKKSLNFGDIDAFERREQLIQAYQGVINELLDVAKKNTYIRTLLQKSLGEDYQAKLKEYLAYIEEENQLAIQYLTSKQDNTLEKQQEITFRSKTISLTTENGQKRPFGEFLEDAVEHGLPWWVIEQYAYNYFGLNPDTLHQGIWQLMAAPFRDITVEPTPEELATKLNAVSGPFTPGAIKTQTT